MGRNYDVNKYGVVVSPSRADVRLERDGRFHATVRYARDPATGKWHGSYDMGTSISGRSGPVTYDGPAFPSSSACIRHYMEGMLAEIREKITPPIHDSCVGPTEIKGCKQLIKLIEEFLTNLTDESEGKTMEREATTLKLDQIEDGVELRHTAPGEDWAGFVESVRENGVLEPVLVRPGENGKYSLIAGRRRYTAAAEAGLEEVPAVIFAADDNDAARIALIENLQRRDLTPVEEGLAFRELRDTFSHTLEDVAARVGRSVPYVSEYIRFLDLPEEATAALDDGRITPSHARVLLHLPDDDARRKLVAEIIEGKLSARMAALRIRRYMTELEDAIFDTAECVGCASNTDNTPSLFEMDVSKGMCLNEECYEKKVQEVYEGTVTAAKAAGIPVFEIEGWGTPEEAADYSEIYEYLVGEDAYREKCGTCLKKACIVHRREDGTIFKIEYMCGDADCMDDLKQEYAEIKAGTDGGSAQDTEERKARRQERRANRMRERVGEELGKQMAQFVAEKFRDMVNEDDPFWASDVAALVTAAYDSEDEFEAFEEITALTPADRAKRFRKTVVKQLIVNVDYSPFGGKEIAHLAGRYGFDPAADFQVNQKYLQAHDVPTLAAFAEGYGIVVEPADNETAKDVAKEILKLAKKLGVKFATPPDVIDVAAGEYGFATSEEEGSADESGGDVSDGS
ncbi:MAG: ParB/RepB/Spo0J family partition protein [Candidatus Zixiibacteriota bacterium]|jgi:ParB family chromosome partitioning protein